MQPVVGLDKLVRVTHQGNDCLVGADSNPAELHLFFPAECQLDAKFLANNNLYRDSTMNVDTTKKGFFETNGRVKAIKFKGIISSGFVIPVASLTYIDSFFDTNPSTYLKVGDEFNQLDGSNICQKYIRPKAKQKGMSNPKTKTIDQIVDSRFVPEHPDTSHLLKNVHKLNKEDYIAVTYKLHGTSARYYNTLVKRPLRWIDRVAKWFGVKIQEEQYEYICASRRVVKSCGFEELPNKNHFFNSGDLWSAVGKEFFEGKLNQGESVYCEIVGKTYSGEAIQHGYTYGLQKPTVYVYRIANINSQGIEVDLPYHQMKERAIQLGVEVCPELFYGTLDEFTQKCIKDERDKEQYIIAAFDGYLEKPSILDPTIIEEGFCVRIDRYPKPEIFKIKSKAFLLHEGIQLDKEVVDLEEEQVHEQSS